jgi:hypothetical protein
MLNIDIRPIRINPIHNLGQAILNMLAIITNDCAGNDGVLPNIMFANFSH